MYYYLKTLFTMIYLLFITEVTSFCCKLIQGDWFLVE